MIFGVWYNGGIRKELPQIPETLPNERRFDKSLVYFIGSLIASGTLFTVALISRKSNPTVFKGLIGSAAVILGVGNFYRAIKSNPRNPTNTQ